MYLSSGITWYVKVGRNSYQLGLHEEDLNKITPATIPFGRRRSPWSPLLAEKLLAVNSCWGG